MFVSVDYENVKKLPGFPSADPLAYKGSSEYCPLKAYLAHAFLVEKDLPADEVVYDVVVDHYPTEYAVSRTIDVVYQLVAAGSKAIRLNFLDIDGTEHVLLEAPSITLASFPVFAVAGKLVLKSEQPFALKYKASILSAKARRKYSREEIEVELGETLLYVASKGELVKRFVGGTTSSTSKR